jgi:hydroxyethylthiazole kinase-like uncharacterized protein yjeF
MKLLTAAETRECDRLTSERFGVPSLTLMENAGTAVADLALTRYPGAARITIVCGKGNNGGDGYVAARHLHQAGKKVSVILLGQAAEVQGDAAAMLAHMTQETPLRLIEVTAPEQLAAGGIQFLFRADLIIDGILGTGFRPPVCGLLAEGIKAMNTSGAPVLAVDIPSGAGADDFAPGTENLRARADAIVTFTAPRPAHLFAGLTSGPTVVAPIGSPDEAMASELHLDAITARDIASFVAFRPVESNKGSFGHALIIGGSVGKSGAAAMAGMAALRAGVGLSTVATAKSALPMVAGFAAEIMTEPLAETDAGSIALSARDYGRLDAIVQGKTVLALGPGISRHPDTVEFIRAVIDKYPQPLVVDADGLNAFEGCAAKLDGSRRPLVLTPHPGEMARLTGLTVKQVQADRIGVARRFAREHHCILVLKGHRTLVAEPEGRVWVNTTGNPGMASGGTGDILTGMVAGLVAQNPSEVARAAAAAVYLHGLAGDVARETVGEHSLVATDLLRALPEAFRRAQEWSTAEKQTIFP